MALKITLHPHERMILSGAVVTNPGCTNCDLSIEENVPVLREKDIMGEKDAHSPCRRIYLAIQLMYVDEKNLAEHHRIYWELVRDVVKAAPSMLNMIERISELISNRRYYKALKLSRKLIEYEDELIDSYFQSVDIVVER